MSTPPSPRDGVMRTDVGCSTLTKSATSASTVSPASLVHSMRVMLPVSRANQRVEARLKYARRSPAWGTHHHRPPTRQVGEVVPVTEALPVVLATSAVGLLRAV